MADALCGPSNSLQQFKQQTSLDRTLQQDRLSSRHVPTQGFRSRDPHAGLLDPEFEAFQAGLPAPDLPQYQPFPQQQQPPQAFQAPSWASDFQRMHISAQGPPPFQQQSLPQQARPQSAAWAQGFREQLSQGTSRAHPQTSSPSPIAFQQQARYGYSGYQSNLAGQPTFAPTVQSKGKEPVTEQFDEAAFERAFDQAKDDLMTDVHDAGLEQDASDMQDFANALNVDVDDIVRSDAANVETLREFAMEGPTNLQTMPLEKQQGEESTQHDQRGEDDALAATAQELLEKVEHNQSDKFRNSQFLGLMRKLRDREVKVEGDKMVEQTAASSADVQHSLTTPSTPAVFDNPASLGTGTRPFAATAVDSRPPDYGIPAHEQDHDSFRHEDGQEVVDLLNQPDVDVGDDADAMVEHEDIEEEAAAYTYDPEPAERSYSYEGAMFGARTAARPSAWG